MTNQKELEHKAKIYAAKIIRLPFVRMVVLTGSVASGRATQKSDIDFLIVTKPGRIYLARAIVVMMANIWGEYRGNNNIAGKLCLNWWRTDIIQKSKIKNQNYNSKFKIDWEKVGEIKTMAKRTRENRVEKLLSGEMGNLLERVARSYQIWRIKKDPRTHVSGSEVRWTDDELGFHPPK